MSQNTEPPTEITVSDVSNIEHAATNEILLRLFRYWNDKRALRQFPARSDIDFLEFTYALGDISLVEIVGNPRRFHYRLVSTNLTDRLGYEMTGRTVEDIPDEATRRYVDSFYTRAITARAPLFEKSTRIFNYQLWHHEALVLPLSSDGEIIDMLMIYRKIFDPAPLPDWARDDKKLHWD